MAVGVETNLLARGIFVINVRTVAQRFPCRGAEIIEIAALDTLCRNTLSDSTGPPILRNVVAPRLRRRDLQGQRVETFRPLTLSAFAALYSGAAGNVGEVISVSPSYFDPAARSG